MMFVSDVPHTDWYLHALENDYCKSSYHLFPYDVITVLLTIFLMLYMTFSLLICSVSGGLYLLVLFTCFVPPPSLVYSLYLCLLSFCLGF